MRSRPNIFRWGTAVALSLLLTVQSRAGEVRVRIEPNLIDLLDRAVLKVDFIDADPESINLPEIKGLKFENLGSSERMVNINGETSKTTTYSYVVTPSMTGTFDISPVTVKYDGTQETHSTRLEVIKKAENPETQKLNDRMFAQLSLDGAEPYVYEPFELQYKIYVQDGIQMAWEDVFGRTLFSVQSGMPESGLDGEPMWKFKGQGRESINGAIYETYTFSVAIKTLASGTLTFQPRVQVHWVVPSQNRRSYGLNDPFMGDLFGRPEARPYTLECNKLEVQVRPIPTEGRPASFTGGVGVFDFEVDVGPDQVEARYPVTIKMRISGTGNLAMLSEPTIPDTSNIKVYESKSVPTQTPNEVGFEQVVIPESEDVQEIPAITFSYFNTRTADFRTITKGPFPITVTPSKQPSAPIVSSLADTAPRATEIIAQDIAYLKPTPAAWVTASNQPLQLRAPLIWFLPLPALLVALAGAVSMRRRALAGNIELARRQQAPKAARKQIRCAEKAIQAGDADAFYKALWDALSTYFGHRLNLAPGQITLQTVLEKVPDESGDIAQLFQTVEHRRYGIDAEPEHQHDEMKQLLHRLNLTLRKCERMKR